MNLDRHSYIRILDELHDGLYIVDLRRIIRYWNKAAERISGYAAAEVVGSSCADNILTHVDGTGLGLCLHQCPLARTMADGTSRQAIIYLHHKDGHRLPVAVRISAVHDDSGQISGAAELFSDIGGSALSQQMQELEDMAFLDHLTRLPNRRFLEKELFMRFEEFKRYDVPFGVLFMDLDHFKAVNDKHGHDTGDRVLKFVANTLVKNARPFDIIGRWGGEEFVGIIPHIAAEQLAPLGERLRVLVERSFTMVGAEWLRVTISLGATIARKDETLASLIHRADQLLYQSKQDGRNRLTLA